MTQFGADMYAALAPIAAGDDQRGYPLAVICGAFGEMFKDVEEVARARPGREPYQQVFDINGDPDNGIDGTPEFLYPWLAQIPGVRDINGLAPADQKAAILAEAGFYRGSVGAMVAKVAQTLAGSQRVRVVERASDAWTMELITSPRETPNPALTARVAEAAKVAMNLLTVIQSDLPIIDEGTRTIDASTGTIDTAQLSDVT